MDSLELRMAGSDQANRALLEQLMKLNQDIKVTSLDYMGVNGTFSGGGGRSNFVKGFVGEAH